MRSRRRFLIGSASAYAAIAAVTAPARSAEFEFKCGGESGPSHPTTIRLTQMWAAIERESGGRIATQFFPNSQLGSPPAVFSQLRIGAVQFQHVASPVISSLVPVTDILTLGFAFQTGAEGARACDGPLGGYLRAEAAAKGVIMFPQIWDTGMYQIGTSTHPVRTPDDLAGMKIRVSESKVSIGLFKELGATPTPLGFSEVYSSLQAKVIDAEAAPLDSIVASRFFEVNKYVSLTNHAWSSEWLIANADVWKSLPADLQAVVERNASKHALLERRDLQINSASIVDKLSRQGIAFNRVDQAPFRGRLGAYYQQWAGAFGSTVWALLEKSVGRQLG